MHWESDEINTFSYLKDATLEIEKELFNALKVKQKGYFFSAAFRGGFSDGFTYFFDLPQKKLLTGLIPFARQLGFEFDEKITAKDPLEDFSLDFELQDPNDKSKSITLTGYQDESVVAVVSGARRGIFDHLTASGKSILMAAICALFKDLQITITVPTIELLVQTREVLASALREDVGSLGGGKKDFEHRINVMYDGFAKQYEKSPFVKNLAFSTQVLIVDELQTATKRMFPFYLKCRNAYYRYGFSGSFFEIDPERIFQVAGYFGGVITTVDDKDTVAAGRSVPINFLFYEFPLQQTRDLDYIYAYSQSIVENDAYNKFFAKILASWYEQEKTIFVLVQRVDHSTRFQKALADLGIESEIYSGKVPKQKRKDLRRDFKAGKIPILIATEKTLSTGIDFPLIDVFLNLGCGFEDNSTKQKYGRSLRSFEGKEKVTIIEPYLTGHRWFLRHARARLNLAKRYKTGTVKLCFLSGIEQSM